jgi:two-component system sensor histidine kinase KdpD
MRAAASHELRTPLAAIAGAATTLLDSPGLDPTAQRDLVQTVRDEAERMGQRVANLLDAERLGSGTLTPRCEWTSAEEWVGTALDRCARSLAGREMRTDLPAAMPLLHIDPVLMEHALVNVVDNAARHRPPGTRIDVTARRTLDGLELRVGDRGPGMTPAMQAAAFEPFWRGTGSERKPGSELGLAIVRGIVQAHGGSVTLRERGRGGLWVCLVSPVKPAPDVAAHMADVIELGASRS